MKQHALKKLPLQKSIETQKVLKKAIQANRALAKLNGVAQIIPNSQILINSLALREAKDSSEIENIITIQKVLEQNDAGARRQSKKFNNIEWRLTTS
jgi:Fic family protein